MSKIGFKVAAAVCSPLNQIAAAVIMIAAILMLNGGCRSAQKPAFDGDLSVCRRDNGKYGYCSGYGATEKLMLPAVYDAAREFIGSRTAAVKINDRWQYIDRTGKIVTPNPPAYPPDASPGNAPVNRDGEIAFVNAAGETVIETDGDYDFARPFHEGFALVGLNGKFGFIDEKGRTVIPLRYDYVTDFSGGLADVGVDGKYGFVDQSGREIVAPVYDQFLYSHQFKRTELIAAKLDGKFGYINRTGAVIIDFKYEAAQSFDNGLAAVRLNNKYGYIDQAGNLKIEFKYDEAGNFSRPYARVKLNGERIAVDRDGKEYNIRFGSHEDTYTRRE